MKELKKDLFVCIPEADAICITTNCSIADDGSNPMGGGCAGAARQRWNNIDKIYGGILKFTPHVPVILGITNKDKYDEFYTVSGEDPFYIHEFKESWTGVIAFPTMHSIFEPANLKLIIRSSELLVEMANKFNWKSIFTPRMGSGIGELDWYKEVKPAIENILDDRFTVVSFEHEE